MVRFTCQYHPQSNLKHQPNSSFSLNRGSVCFQVDQIKDTFRWKSAILLGDFVELTGEQHQQAMQGIIHRIMPLTNRPSQDSSHGIKVEEHASLVVYRIELTKATGKYEDHNL